MLFGVNPASSFLIASLGLDGKAPTNFYERLSKFDEDGYGEYNLYSEEAKALLQEAIDTKYFPTGRFRDIYFERNEDGIGGKVILYTRNGGGNRDAYEYVFELLSKHPLYLNDYDDDFDCTYAYIEFTAPESVVEFFADVEATKFERVSERFKREIAEMEAGKEPNERLKTFMEGFIETLNNKK
jgi:hypothetical protein